MTDIFSWGVATYPGRFGIMNSQLHATSATGYFLNAAIYDNRLTQPVGIQFLCSASGDNPDNLARRAILRRGATTHFSGPYDAVNNSLTAGVGFGCNFIVRWTQSDVNNPSFRQCWQHKKRLWTASATGDPGKSTDSALKSVAGAA